MKRFDRTVAFLGEVAKQIEREREVARPIVETLRTTIGERWDSDVPPQWRTSGFVAELTAAAAFVLETDPRSAQALAQYAIVVVTSIPEKAYPEPILAGNEAEAWKELASAHRYLSDYEAALRALDAADRRVAGIPSLDFERAVLRFARALVLCDMHMFSEARALTDESAAVFVQYKDSRRAGQALILRGMIEARSSDLHAAAETFNEAIEVFQKCNDLRSLASAFNNLGYAQTELGNISGAVLALRNALAIFEELALMGEAARTRSVLACVLMRNGEYARARDLFFAARETFRSLGMIEEAGIAGLDLADALLALSDTAAARTVVEAVFTEFAGAKLTERAATALAYVRELLPTSRGRAAVCHVKKYIEELRHQPDRLFVPLPEK